MDARQRERTERERAREQENRESEFTKWRECWNESVIAGVDGLCIAWRKRSLSTNINDAESAENNFSKLIEIPWRVTPCFSPTFFLFFYFCLLLSATGGWLTNEHNILNTRRLKTFAILLVLHDHSSFIIFFFGSSNNKWCNTLDQYIKPISLYLATSHSLQIGTAHIKFCHQRWPIKFRPMGY